MLHLLELLLHLLYHFIPQLSFSLHCQLFVLDHFLEPGPQCLAFRDLVVKSSLCLADLQSQLTVTAPQFIDFNPGRNLQLIIGRKDPLLFIIYVSLTLRLESLVLELRLQRTQPLLIGLDLLLVIFAEGTQMLGIGVFLELERPLLGSQFLPHKLDFRVNLGPDAQKRRR